MALLTGLSALTGGLANTQKARTGTYGSTSGGSTSSTGSNRRFVTPEQQALQSPILQNIMQQLENPASFLQAGQTAARENVNANFAGMEDTLRQKYGTGAGASGKFGRAARGAETERLRGLSQVDSQFALARQGVQQQGLGNALSLLGMNFGTDVSSTGSQQQQQDGFSTAPGSALAGALESGGTVLGAQQTELFRNLILLQQLTGGGGF